jgi:hypothetical protein
MKEATGALELASVGTGRGEGEGGDEGWSAGASSTGTAAAEGREAITKVCGDAVGGVAGGRGRGAGDGGEAVDVGAAADAGDDAGSSSSIGSGSGAGDDGNTGGTRDSDSGEAGSSVSLFIGSVGGELGGNMAWYGGMVGVSVVGGGVTRLGGGERRSSSSPSQSLSNSSSLRLFLVFFAGGEATSGDGRGEGTVPGWVMVRQDWQESGVLHEPDPPVHRWRLYRAFDSGDGDGGASRLQRWSRLAPVRGRTR